MAKVVVRYKAKSARADENQRLVEQVFAELDERDPGGMQYVCFRLDDGVSSLHLASIDTEDGSNPLSGIEAFAEFTRDIGARCEEPPASQSATLVGSYGVRVDGS